MLHASQPVRGADGRADDRFTFPGDWLNGAGNNVFQFALPYNASGGDVNFRNYSVSVMYVTTHMSLTAGTMRSD